MMERVDVVSIIVEITDRACSRCKSENEIEEIDCIGCPVNLLNESASMIEWELK